jgi:hypothetical protein
MNWKDLPYWLRGGILLSSLSILGGVPVLLFFAHNFEEFLVIFTPTYFLFVFKFMRPEPPTTGELVFVYSTAVITSALLWFLVGVLLGWVWRKLKPRTR